MTTKTINFLIPFIKRIFTLGFLLLVCPIAFAQWINVGPGGEALSTVCFRTKTSGWAGGANAALWRTSDGGTTWQAITDFSVRPGTAHNRILGIATPLLYNVAILTQEPSAARPTGIYYSLYSGDKFEKDSVSSNAEQSFLSNHGNRDSEFLMLVGKAGALHLSTNYGQIWRVLVSGTQNDLFGADSPDGHTFYMVGARGTLRKGLWQDPVVTSRALNSTTFARLTGVWFVTPEQGFIIGDNGTALRTTDGGTTWLPMLVSTQANLNAVRFLDANTGYIAGDLGTLLHTADGGRTWQPESSGTFETLNAIFATPDGQHIWIAGGGGTILTRGDMAPLAGHPATAASAWEAYPNPFTISLNLALPPSAAFRELRLLDPVGRTVLLQTLSPRSTVQPAYTVPVSTTLSPGVYSLQILTPGLSPETRQLVRLP